MTNSGNNEDRDSGITGPFRRRRKRMSVICFPGSFHGKPL
jgi:hypothetical protein